MDHGQSGAGQRYRREGWHESFASIGQGRVDSKSA